MPDRIGIQKTEAVIASGSVFIPVVGPFISLAATVASIIPIGSDPRKVPDTQTIEYAMISLNAIWLTLTGEDLGTKCNPGRCGAQHVTFLNSKYPDVPSGPRGNMQVNIDEAIQMSKQIILRASNSLLRKQSAQNQFFTTQAPYKLGLLQKVKAARNPDPRKKILSLVKSPQLTWLSIGISALGLVALLLRR